MDFFDVKGVVETLCRALGVPVRFEPWREPFLVAGQTASIVCANGPAAGAVVGLIGRLTTNVNDASGLPRQDPVYVAELGLDGLARARATSDDRVQPLPRFPFVVRDLSVVVSDTLPAELTSLAQAKICSRDSTEQGPAIITGLDPPITTLPILNCESFGRVARDANL